MTVRSDDGAAYERMMGVWSRLAGGRFLDWLAPAPGQRWIDVGCGNGAFTELLVERCAPLEIIAIDPSEDLIKFARARHKAGKARFRKGDAMALTCADRSFNAAVMALVIFFVPDPAQSVLEMKRVVKPGGSLSAYVWDILAPGGNPLAVVQDELYSLGGTPVLPPRAEVSRIDALSTLWSEAGLVDVATHTFAATRCFADFDDVWGAAEIVLGMAQETRCMEEDLKIELKNRVHSRVAPDDAGQITLTAQANAVAGHVPA